MLLFYCIFLISHKFKLATRYYNKRIFIFTKFYNIKSKYARLYVIIVILQEFCKIKTKKVAIEIYLKNIFLVYQYPEYVKINISNSYYNNYNN